MIRQTCDGVKAYGQTVFQDFALLSCLRKLVLITQLFMDMYALQHAMQTINLVLCNFAILFHRDFAATYYAAFTHQLAISSKQLQDMYRICTCLPSTQVCAGPALPAPAPPGGPLPVASSGLSAPPADLTGELGC